MLWPKTARPREIVDLANRFDTHAEARDRAGTFPHEHFIDLHRGGLLALAIPRAFGALGPWGPVQRYDRDIRAGRHHPPMDAALATLARAALGWRP